MKYFILAIVFILAIDIIGFLLWYVSGQVPSDGFYIGTITAHIINLKP